MTFKIEKNIPIPAKVGRECIYPFAQMVPGDSFSVEVTAEHTLQKLRAKLTAQSTQWKKRHADGAKFTVRAADDGKSVRIWLVTKPAPLAPLSMATLPVSKVHTLADDDEPAPKRKGRLPKVSVEVRRTASDAVEAARARSFDVPSFATASQVKGARY